MDPKAEPFVSPERHWATADRETETVAIENLYLAPDPSDPDEDLGDTYTAYLYDPDNEPEEIATGPVGAVPFKMSYAQANALRIKLNRLFC